MISTRSRAGRDRVEIVYVACGLFCPHLEVRACRLGHGDVRDEPGLSGHLHDPVYTLKLLDTDSKGLILYE